MTPQCKRLLRHCVCCSVVIFLIYSLVPTNSGYAKGGTPKPLNKEIFYESQDADYFRSPPDNQLQHGDHDKGNLSAHLPLSTETHTPLPTGFHFVFTVDCKEGQHRTMAFTLIYSFLSMYTEDSGNTLTELITYA